MRKVQSGFRRLGPIAVLLLLPTPAQRAANPADPLDSKLEERLETELVQLDVAIDGSAEAVRSLQAKDFSLTVGGKDIEGFTADPLCNESPPEGREAEPDVRAPQGASVPSFLFYFDQPHLTIAGRTMALDLAHDLIDRLVVRGARAAIVSSAAKLTTVVPLTGDRARLQQGLERLRGDPAQGDPYAATEEIRIAEIANLLRIPDLEGARHQARAFADEEWRQARQSEVRFGLSLKALEGQRPPRGAFYFGDTLRQDAGQHYFKMVPREPGDRGGAASSLDAAAAFDFDRLVRDALAVGVHLFPVQAEGMAPDAPRVRSAENALISLGLESGGEGFIRGVPATRIADRVSQRLGCIYLLSFKAKGLPTDQMLPVTVSVSRAGVKAHAQGLIVIPSASARRTSRLLAAFTQGATDEPSAGFGASLIFLSVEKDRYRVLVQLRAPPTGTRNGAWDLGASLVGRGSVRDEFSAHIGTSAPDVPIVLEREATLGVGPYEIVAAAQGAGDRYLSAHLEGELPVLEDSRWVSPTAVVQEGTAAFSRDDRTRAFGSVVVRDGEPLNGRKPVALISVACRANLSEDAVIERRLTGADAVKFDPIRFAAAERCAQVRDLIPGKLLGPGAFTYEIQVKRGDAVLQSGSRRLLVANDAPVSGHAATAEPAAPRPPR